MSFGAQKLIVEILTSWLTSDNVQFAFRFWSFTFLNAFRHVQVGNYQELQCNY